MYVGSSLWSGSGKIPMERRAPPLASTPSLCRFPTQCYTHLFTKKVTRFCLAHHLWTSLYIYCIFNIILYLTRKKISLKWMMCEVRIRKGGQLWSKATLDWTGISWPARWKRGFIRLNEIVGNNESQRKSSLSGISYYIGPQAYALFNTKFKKLHFECQVLLVYSGNHYRMGIMRT